MPAYIRLNMFPATVTRADGTKYDPARVVVTEDTIYVFMDSHPKPKEVFVQGLYDYESISRTHYVVTTDGDQEQIDIQKRTGCGCGNRLRGFNAFPGVPLMKNR